jgi:16S rRNA (cytidine1402-2'-O)-methyltransferase
MASGELLACEDTRRTGKLLELLDIDTSRIELVSYHEHSGDKRRDELLQALQAGRRVVLVSDAGTPAISDPGYRLVRGAIDRGLEVTALPGPNAAVTALSGSGLPTDSFLFGGFLPKTSKARRQSLADFDESQTTLIFYESTKRLTNLLEDISVVCGDSRSICIARELTKMHEEYIRGEAGELVERLAKRETLRGEIVVLVGPRPESSPARREQRIDDKIKELLEDGMSARTIRAVISELYEIPRSGLYDRIHDIEADSADG